MSYATLEDAMVACDANPECSGVYDGDCNGDDYYMCDKDGAYESSSASCVHVKAKAASTPTTASPTTASPETAAPTAEPALGRRALVWCGPGVVLLCKIRYLDISDVFANCFD